MLIYKTFEEFNRFFHQPMHYPTIEDIEIYLRNKDAGAFSVISEIYYKVLPQYLPKEIEDKFGEENDPFDISKYPYYYKVKNDENIDDGTLNISDRKSFSKFAEKLLMDYKKNGEKWEIKRIDDFIENINRYAEDIDGYYKNMNFETSAETPTWRIFAQILKGATVYE
ncbi:hypothetical protein DFQ09_11210 [Winogradskyella pacifica]|uniref:DUF7660 domain-containing protein n=1 Tax=Winogradskyella pacifica TaxID=664642 RepID=A0A3D9LNS8_9FLAO|nr:hypothetical protein [Winogradskyella pacifica]REE07663.1 hypothetical protein DFQ09_11210 [Winogradskyella pacifica]